MPTKEERRKQKVKREREIRSSLLILDWKDCKWKDIGKQEEGKTVHKVHVLEDE